MTSSEFERSVGEETQALLRQVIERQAYRLLMASNIRGHGMRFLTDLADRKRFAHELDFGLRVLQEIERLYAELGGGDLHLAVRERMERIPYPETALDFAACIALIGRAELASAGSFVDSVSKPYAAIARTVVAADPEPRLVEERLFVDYCSDPTNRPMAQEYWNRWMAVAVLSFGRPGTRGDARVVELRLRSRHSADVVHDFLDSVEPLRGACGLENPPLEGFGIELPEELRNRFGAETE